MAILTRDELINPTTGAYADNSTQAITAATHRDFVESVMVYGAMASQNDQVLAVSGTPTVIPFETSPFVYGMTAHPGTSNDFKNVVVGHYRVSLYLEATLLANSDYTLYIVADGVPGRPFNWNTRDSGELLSQNFSAAYDVAATVASIYVTIEQVGGAGDITLHSAQFIIERMGSA